ncbi:ATP-binding protein [Archangium violaceum]|uniref:histidine kinase n=1 Tax=Archangium violaceum Cb vi76 TaxID=1406225 RepID=A0A084SSC4_9BACT|nr:ATP-binding protein [Archangium violaceum]KFA91359.1 diguanylate cyclase [Archangium violaceum Cb vi76]
MIPPPFPPDEPRRLQALLRLGLLDTPAEERFDRIVRMAARTFRVPITLVSLVDGSRQWFKARVGLDAASTARSISFCGHAILTPDTFVVRDALEDQRFADNPLVTGEPHVRFYAGHPLHAPDGSPVGTLCLIDRRARDFSAEERQQLEDLASWVELELNALTVQEARTALAQQERFFALSVDMLCIAGVDGTFRQLSRAWTQTLGHSERTLRATPLLELVHAEDRASTAEWLARGARGELLPYFEHRCRGQDGAWHWLQWNATVNPEEGIFYGVARDVTEQKRLEAERRQMERMKSEFVSTVSHELRTPLTSIRGSLGLLEGGVLGELPSQAQDMVRIARTNTERLIRLINDILDLEKMESGKLDFHLEPLELGALLAQAVEAHQGYAGECGARLELVVEASGARVMADGDRFLQVLANLLSNALKFSPRGERVTLRLERVGSRLRVSVEDRGPGIPESFRARIFEKFAQADGSDTRRKGGTGLGLSIARALVERMGGTLDFVTTEGTGTTFRVELPEHTEAGAPSTSVPHPLELATRCEPQASRPRVLHVEADEDNRRVVANVLRDVADVVPASGLAEAEAALRSGPFPLVIAEPVLPEGGPLPLAPLLAAAPVVLFSVREAEPELARQVSAVLVKSRTSNEELRSAVLRLLRSTAHPPPPRGFP